MNTSRLISYFLAVFSLVNVAGASAQTVAVLGELQSADKVFISSSTGKWAPSMPTYPLIQDTGLRTEDGSASIFFKDDSSVVLSKDTIVSIAGGAPNYTINLAKGVIAFINQYLPSLYRHLQPAYRQTTRRV